AEAQRQYEGKEKEAGEEAFRQAERAVMLRVIDMLWVEHLDAMMKLREAIGLHGYGQRDPLVEYKQEGYQMFQRLQAAIAADVARLIFKVKIVNTPPVPKPVEQVESGPEEPTGDFEDEKEEMGNTQRTSSAVAGSLPWPEGVDKKKVGRNDDCPCGSGLKFKKCHGK